MNLPRQLGQLEPLVGSYSGRDMILIGGGPSFGKVDLIALRRSQALTMSLNNAIQSFRTDLWLGVDPPHRFIRSVWLDESVKKFTPWRHRKKHLAGKPAFCADRCPNTVFYVQSTWFNREQMFAPHDPNEWDNRRGNGHRTSFMDALRILHLLGVQRVFLFGIDFMQSRNLPYHHDARPSAQVVNFNNQTYPLMAERLRQLRPLMEASGMQVFNCNPDSYLDAFDKITPEDAFKACRTGHEVGALRRRETPSVRELYIDGMQGLGDSIYARPCIRAACERYDRVWLCTPWPQLYWDMHEKHGLCFVKPSTALRTQRAHVADLPLDTWARPPARLQKRVRLHYNQRDFRSGLSINAILERRLPLHEVPFNFDLPLKRSWVLEAERLLNQLSTSRPIAIYRPVTLRREWPAPARNPDPEVVRHVAEWLNARYYVISVAHLALGEEYIATPGPTADVEFHNGELSPEVIAALMQSADLTVAAVGFALPMALAVGCRSLIMYGASVPPACLVDHRINHMKHWSLVPEPFITCGPRKKNLTKAIPSARVEEVLSAVWNNISAAVSRERELVWWPSRGMGYYPVREAEMPYDDAYFEKYRSYEGTALCRQLNHFRVELVNKYTKGVVLDCGIGSGTFIMARGAHTVGYDVNPAGRKWLMHHGLFVDPYHTNDVLAITCWDTLEHIRDPDALLRRVRDLVFLSMPIYKNAEHALRSKHFRPTEHYWYFTRDGLVMWMKRHGFTLVDESDAESHLGREDIGTFVFKRTSLTAAGQLGH